MKTGIEVVKHSKQRGFCVRKIPSLQYWNGSWSLAVFQDEFATIYSSKRKAVASFVADLLKGGL